MQLIQILLPLSDDEGRNFPASAFERLARELTERFGGVTSFTRTPAEGRWKDAEVTAHDDIVVIEVMTESVERGWWTDLRRRLEQEFKQEEVVIRCQQTERL
jgi:hypothetical protein